MKWDDLLEEYEPPDPAEAAARRLANIDELVAAWRRFEPPAPPGPPIGVAVLYRDGKPLCMAPTMGTLVDVCGKPTRCGRTLTTPPGSIGWWGPVPLGIRPFFDSA